jgi:zinc-ribbon domain
MSGTCKKCGAKNEESSLYCTSCGTKLKSEPNAETEGKYGNETPLKRKGLSWKWVLVSIGMILLIQIIFLSVAEIICYSMNINPNQPIILDACIIVSFFLGSLWAAFKSPGLTIKEPAIGSAIWVVVTTLFVGNLSDVLLGWILPFLLALGGAKCGEYLQAKKTRYNDYSIVCNIF